jgi:hypothetical protein
MIVVASRGAGLVGNALIFLVAAAHTSVSSYGAALAWLGALGFAIGLLDGGLSTWILRQLADGQGASSYRHLTVFRRGVSLFIMTVALFSAVLVRRLGGLSGTDVGLCFIFLGAHVSADISLMPLVALFWQPMCN